jgi:hypothetical protein
VTRGRTAFPPAPRREFLGQLATGAVALATAGCAGATSTAAAAPAPAAPARPRPASGAVDDSWTARITGKHRAVFDAPEIAEGVVIANAYVFLLSYTDARKLTDSDLSAVAVIRHAAIPMALDDAMWEKYRLGKFTKTREPGGKAWARRNVYWRAAANDQASAPFTLDALRGRGVILLGCALATRRLASTLAAQTKQQHEAVHDELRSHLIDGLQLAPSGIYAVTLAQEAGCSYVRST